MSRKKKIYIIEDDGMFANLLSDYITSHTDHEVYWFSTGEACLGALRNAPDIIILDYFLNSQDRDAADGLQVLRKIRKSGYNSRILFLSGQQEFSIAMRSKMEGADHYLMKDSEAFPKILEFIDGPGIALKRTDSENPEFISLVKLLDAELAERNGNEHSFYAQYNKIDSIRHVVVANIGTLPVSCGAIKEYDSETMEVKRMFTLPPVRGKGIAAAVLAELEQWARELGYEKCVLETGKKQPEAIALYHRNGYRVIPNYGQYAGVENSVCFEKMMAGVAERANR